MLLVVIMQKNSEKILIEERLSRKFFFKLTIELESNMY